MTDCLLPLTRSRKPLEPMVLASDSSGSSPSPFEPQIAAMAQYSNLKEAHANKNKPCDLCNKKFATLWEVKGRRESVHCTNIRVSTLLLSSPSLPAPDAHRLHQRPIKRRAVINQPPPPDPLESFDPFEFAFANPCAQVDISIRSPAPTDEVFSERSSLAPLK